MKCQHCRSDDIVVIQGQNYCLSCGYAVAAAALVKTSGASGAAPKTKPRPKLQTSKTKRPASKAAAVAQTAPVATAAKMTTTHPDTDIVPSTPARRVQLPQSDNQPTNRKSSQTVVHPLRFSLLVALVAALLAGIITAAVLWFQLDSDTGAYAITATVVSLGIGVGLAHAALLYGRARSQDGRPTPRAYWWLAARSGFMDVVNVQLIAIICALLLTGVGVVVWRGVTAGSLHLGIAAAVVLGVVNLVLIWALLGVYTAARLATPAVVIGGYSATAAVTVGWQLYLKAGGHLIVAAIEALLSRAIAAIILAVVGYATVRALSVSSAGTVAAGSGIAATLVVFVAVMLSLEIDTKLWLAQYRHWVTLRPPAERIRLLTGRVQSHL